MIRSMTGFGKTSGDIGNTKITVEMRSLNSKQFDLNLRMPGVYREKESEIRTFLAGRLERGKVDLNIIIETVGTAKGYCIDFEAARKYIIELEKLQESTGIKNNTDLLQIVMRMPDVVKSSEEEADDEKWTAFFSLVCECADKLDEFRLGEGTVLEKDFMLRISRISELLKDTDKFEYERVAAVKDRLARHLSENVGAENVDKNRFEQEVIYYLEKMDFTEEKVRLCKHLDYFIQTLKDEESPGRKLSFIVQEMGREINTLGSKANHAEIQNVVIRMKDELEKIKEQGLNIL